MNKDVLLDKIGKLRKIDLIKFVKYNFFTSQVKRKKGAYIIPFKGAVLEMAQNSELVLEGTIHFGINQLQGSNSGNKEGIYELEEK